MRYLLKLMKLRANATELPSHPTARPPAPDRTPRVLDSSLSRDGRSRVGPRPSTARIAHSTPSSDPSSTSSSPSRPPPPSTPASSRSSAASPTCSRTPSSRSPRRSSARSASPRGICQMKTQKMANGSSCNKNKVFDSLIGEDVSEIDPSYKIFLEHLSEDGKTYVFDVPNGDHGMPASVRYEEDGMSYGDANAKYGTNVPNSLLHRSRVGPNGKRPGVTSGRAANINVGSSFLPRTSSVKKTSAIDESYAAFLSLVKIKDGFMVIELEPGVTIVYEQEEEVPAGCDELRTGSSTNEREPWMVALENMEEENDMLIDEDGLGQTDNIASEHEMDGLASDNVDSQNVICTDEHGLVPYTESSDLNACDDDQGAPLALSCGGPSTFDEKLNAVLSQPYDQNEYKELLCKATDRKPVSRQRHLRSASKRYATGAIGLSYLDYYPDLAIQINSADCDERRLSLLRKFFFWLENLCHEGAHMPWIPRALACDPIATDDYEPEPQPQPQPMLALEMLQPQDEN